MRPGPIALAIALLSAAAAPVDAQGGSATAVAFPALPRALPDSSSGQGAVAPAGVFALSLAVPGAGQARLGLARWPAYLALEAGLWWLWADARGDFRDHRAGYRDLAWETARIQEGPRRDAGWPYYEAMSHWLSSGEFDTDPAPGLQPEEDATTYNGSVWEVARGIYLPGGVPEPGTPEHEAALEWYEERAAGPEFLWSWEGQESELARFRGLIRGADDARRTQTTALGLILANHLVSAVDALLAARLRGPNRPELRSGLLRYPSGSAWALHVRVPLTNRK